MDMEKGTASHAVVSCILTKAIPKYTSPYHAVFSRHHRELSITSSKATTFSRDVMKMPLPVPQYRDGRWYISCFWGR